VSTTAAVLDQLRQLLVGHFGVEHAARKRSTPGAEHVAPSL
jgi:hypothetical protein